VKLTRDASPGLRSALALFVSYYTYAGEHARAMEWLEKAVDIRDPNVPYVSQPDYDPLRNGSRYTTVMRRLNLPN